MTFDAPEAKARYDQLSGRVDALTDQVSGAMKAVDPRRVAELRLERAHVEMQLRDHCGAWSTEGHRWNNWMWDDIRKAQEIADLLADDLGDAALRERLFMPYPALRVLVTG